MPDESGSREEVEQPKKRKLGRTTKVSLGVLGGLSLLMGYISAAGMRESEVEAEARKPIDDFFSALNARDVDRSRRTLHYPHIQIAGCDVSILESPADFEINYQALADDGWTYSTLDSCTMRHFCDEKVHFELQLSMHNANDSRYATYQALWIVSRRNGVWGIQCRSVFPSGSRLA